MKTMKNWVAAAALVAMAGAAQAALVDRGGGMIYDTTRNITWLADMNYANGTMTRSAAIAWADGLVYGGFSDWRLPTLNLSDASCTGAIGPGSGFNCSGGELSGLFVTDLGNKARESVLYQVGDTPEQIANLALFSNVQNNSYWSSTNYTGPVSGAEWSFAANSGVQGISIIFMANAVAVRPGDVAAVPEPQTYALLLVGLGAVVVAVRRRPR